MQKLIITIAPTGNATKELNPNTPFTPKEIAEDIQICCELGATIAHIHARDKEGRPTHDRNVYEKIMDELAKRNVSVLKELTTGIRADEENTIDGRGQMINLPCELIAMTPGSINFKEMLYANPPDMVRSLAQQITNEGLKASLGVFDAGMIYNAFDLLDDGLLKGNLYFGLAMGYPGAMPATPKNLLFLNEMIPPQHVWTVTCESENNISMLTMAIILGGHVRVGLEDTIYYDNNVLATNRMLIERVIRISKELGREIASPDEAREILGINQK